MSKIGTNKLFGVTLVKSCGSEFEYNDTCYNICPDGYGTKDSSNRCQPCDFYSFYGDCVTECPGFSYGKVCSMGESAYGFVKF